MISGAFTSLEQKLPVPSATSFLQPGLVASDTVAQDGKGANPESPVLRAGPWV